MAATQALEAFGPDNIHTLFTGLDTPDPITFTVSPDWLDRPNLYPRQATLLKIVFLRDDLLTDYDHTVIDEWETTFERTGNEGICPDVRGRIATLKARGARWFPEVLLVMGRRGGKGHISAIAMAYVIWCYLALGDPQGHYGVDRDKQLACLIFAGKRDQAKANLWGDLANVITGGSCFAPYVNANQAEKVSLFAPHDFVRLAKLAGRGLATDRDQASIVILPKESTTMAGRGPASFIIGFDEMAHVVAAGANRSAEEVWTAATPSLDQFKQDSFIIQPSSPYQMTGQFFANYEASLAREETTGELERPDILMLQLPSWDIYQDWDRAPDIPLLPAGFTGDLGEYEHAPHPGFVRLKGAIQEYDDKMRILERSNPETFSVERRSHFATVVDAYLRADKVDDMFAPWQERPAHCGPPLLTMQTKGLLAVTYAGHADPSESNCNFGLAVGHVEIEETEDGPVKHVVFDLLHHWDPADFEDHVIDYDLVCREIYKKVLIPFLPSTFTFDQFNSAQSIQWLARKIREARLPKSVSVYRETATAEHNWIRAEIFKTALNLGRTHAPGYYQAEAELKFLQKPPGQRKVIAPTIGPIQTKDVADCAMEVVQKLIGDEITVLIEQLGSLRLAGGQSGGTRAFPAMDGERMPMPDNDPRQQLSGWGRRGRVPGYGPTTSLSRGRRFGRSS